MKNKDCCNKCVHIDGCYVGKDCPCHKEQWKEEFEGRFTYGEDDSKIRYNLCQMPFRLSEDIKDFITNLLAKREKEWKLEGEANIVMPAVKKGVEIGREEREKELIEGVELLDKQTLVTIMSTNPKTEHDSELVELGKQLSKQIFANVISLIKGDKKEI